MIAFAMLGSNDLDRAKAFYATVLGKIGAREMFDGPAPTGASRLVGFGHGPDQPMLMVVTPLDGNAATVGNGTMVALACASKQDVDSVHAAALALGGTCEGAPGPRAPMGFYCGYFRDLDGNKLNAFCAKP